LFKLEVLILVPRHSSNVILGDHAPF